MRTNITIPRTLIAALVLAGYALTVPAAQATPTPRAAAASQRADADQVALLKRSLSEWNQWRTDNPDIKPDLTGADLTEANLVDANLSNATLRHAVLASANLTRANLHDADLTEANLDGANLTDTDLSCRNHPVCVSSSAG